MVLSVAAGCTARSCIDVQDPIKVRKLKEWAESDARFLRKLSMMKKDNQDLEQNKSERLSGAAPLISQRSESLERLVCRQIYLRSYKFDKKEENDHDAVKQKKKSCWQKLKYKWKVGKNNEPKTTKKSKGCSNCSQTLKGGFKFLLSFISQADVCFMQRKPSILQVNLSDLSLERVRITVCGPAWVSACLVYQYLL